MEKGGLKTSSSRKGEVALLATLNHTLRYEDITCNSSTRVDRLSIAASHFSVSRLDPANGRKRAAQNRTRSWEYCPINREAKGF